VSQKRAASVIGLNWAADAEWAGAHGSGIRRRCGVLPVDVQAAVAAGGFDERELVGVLGPVDVALPAGQHVRGPHAVMALDRRCGGHVPAVSSSWPRTMRMRALLFSGERFHLSGGLRGGRCRQGEVGGVRGERGPGRVSTVRRLMLAGASAVTGYVAVT